MVVLTALRACREVRLRWLYMGREDGEEYCLHVAKIFDRCFCAFLAVAYIIIVVTLFSLADVESTPSYS